MKLLLISLLIGLIIVVLLINVFHVNITIDKKPEPEEKVSVATIFGCLETLDNAKTFAVRQEMMRDVFGIRIMECKR